MICPKCSSSLMFIRKSNGKKLYCEHCGNTINYVNPDYSNYHETRYSYLFERNEKNDPLIDKIVKVMEISKHDKVLDYGCGSGDITRVVSKYAKYVIGVDIDIKTAKEKYNDLVFLLQKSKGLDFPDNYFDRIICVNVIEHVHDYVYLLKEFKRVLKPEGKIFITSYDKNFILHKILNDPTHVIEWNKLEFEKIISKKYDIVASFRYGSFFNYRPLNRMIVKFLKPELCVVASKRA